MQRKPKIKMENEESNDNLCLLEGRNINLMDFLPKILNTEKENFRITPSQFIKEMSFSTEERYKKLVYITSYKKILNNTYPPEFMIIPHIILFQNFEAKGTYCLVLEIRNAAKYVLPIKIRCPNSEYFSANFIKGSASRLAPGLSTEYEIKFTPMEAKDYIHYIMFKTLGKTFKIPCVAIGARPMLDIPDQIVLNPTPVKIAINKFVVVRNIGDAHAVFAFSNQSDNFQVNPSKGVLEANESMMLNISFESPRVCQESDILYLSLETGELLEIVLHGSAENVGVRLDKNSIVHEDTFLGLKRSKSVRLSNSSSSIVKFSWKKNISFEKDLSVIESMSEKYKEISDIEILKEEKILYHELCDSRSHTLSCKRILKNELQLLKKEDFSFSHESFGFVPQSGEVWPRSYLDILVTFEPKVCGVITADAYLEVSGRDSRLPLRLKGTSMGPDFILNVNSLDIDYIYLCSFHRYEIITTNKGDIFGTIMYTPEPLAFGGKVEVVPASRYLAPGQSAAFILSYTSNRQGEFIERINFIIKESQKIVTLIFKGKIISPTLHFDIRQVDFGIVPIGFPTVREVTLNNLSMVPVTFSLRISTDGNVPSLSYEQFAKFAVKPHLPKYPQEFHIEPEESVVEPFSSKKVTLTLTANRAGDFLTHLVVDMWDSESGSVSCPIHFHPQIATVVVDPEVITIPFCFINFPYTRSIILRNMSKIAGYFYIVPCDPKEESPMTCSANIPQGLIEPRTTIKVDITVITNALGRQIVSINLLIFGHDSPKEVCTISCVGQGPVVSVNRDALHWGDLNLLEEAHKTIVLANESPIPANLTISLLKQNSPWSASPSNTTLAPDKTITVTVSLLLYDRGKYKDALRINVYNGKLLNVPLSATGVGSSLKISPPISPSYDLGTLFSHKKYEFDILIENKGSKPYGLIWSPFPDYKAFIALKLVNPQEIVFKIEPPKLDLLPGESKKVTLIVLSPTTGPMSQTFYVFANIGVPVKELHIIFQVLADFAEPLISFDKTDLKFWYNIGSNGANGECLEADVKITNLSVLPINLNVSVQYPFYVQTEEKDAHNMEMILNGMESKTLTTKFVAELNESKYSRIYRDHLTISFKENFKKFLVSLNGEVNYPNVAILPQRVSFGNVAEGIFASREICLVNVSPFAIHFHISWNAETSVAVPERKSKKYPNSTTANGNQETEEVKNLEQKSVGDSKEVASSNAQPKHLEEPRCKIPRKPASRKSGIMPDIVISNSDIKSALFPLTRNYQNCDEKLMHAYELAHSLREIEGEVPEYSKMCDIIPFYGTLEEYGSQILTVRFRADYPVKLDVEAFLNVESGPTEIISIDGYVDEIDFQLSKVNFDFGKQLFCESKTRNLKIVNSCATPLAFEVIPKSSQCESPELSSLDRAVTVTPQQGEVKPFSETNLSVACNPGVPGKFEEKFYLQILHLEPRVIKVKGFGVFPQVLLTLPRPDVLNFPPELGYIAVAEITPDWLLSKYSQPDICSYPTIKACKSQESSIGDLPEKEVSDLLHNGWELIQNETLPSVLDIQLAIERVMAYKFISKNPLKNAAFALVTRNIPYFSVPAYELGFGVTIIGRNAEQSVTIINRGPLPALVFSVFEPVTVEGIHIRLKTRNEIKAGCCLPFVVSFFPKKNIYNKKLEAIDFTFHLEVYHGPKIPINISAQVTYPHLIPSITSLKYYEVICGCCKLINLRLKNPGWVTAVWSMTFLKKSGEFSHRKDEIKYDPSAFYLPLHSGSLEPKEYFSVPIFFQPKYGGLFAAIIAIQVEYGLEEIKVELTGEGIEPKLNISKNVLSFGPTLPYPDKAEQSFTVQNPCDFPIELYFPTFDEQIFEEEKVIRAICHYYHKKELLLPVRQPGEPLLSELVNFYQVLLAELNEQFMEQERRKNARIEESTVSVMSSEEDFSISQSQQFVAEKKKKKTRRSVSRSRTSMESSRVLSESVNEATKEASAYSLLSLKSSLEIEKMLQDYIKSLSIAPTYDPLQAAFRKMTGPQNHLQKGILIIFHGAPYTNAVQLANRAAMIAEMPLLNIDKIVLEEAVLGRCEAGTTVKELIEQAYYDYVEIKKKESSHILWEEIGEAAEDTVFEQEFDELQRKFNALISLREELISNRGKKVKQASPKSGGSKKTEKASPTHVKPMNLNAPIANITDDLIAEILKYRIPIEVTRNVVLEGLRSQLVTYPTKALLSILKAATTTKEILVIVLLNNYEDYNQHINNLKMKQENKKLRFREEILNVLEEEPIEIFESLNLIDEDATKIQSLFFTQRREAHVLFENKKKNFYETIRLNAKAKRKGAPLLVLPQETKLETEKPHKNKQSRKEKKKETASVGKPSRGGTEKSGKTGKSGKSGKTGSEGKSARGKKNSLEREFLAFELEFKELKTIIDNWDQRLGAVVIDNSLDPKLKKGQTPRKSEPEALKIKQKENKGIFLWLVNVSKSDKNFFDQVCYYLKSVVQKQQKIDESDDWPLMSTESTCFSVITYPQVRTRGPVLDIFNLSPRETLLLPEDAYGESADYFPSVPVNMKLSRSATQFSFRSKRKACVSSKRLKLESRMSESKFLRDKKRNTVASPFVPPIKSRWILQPGEILTCRVRYFPVEKGVTEQTYPIQIVNWPNADEVRCIGTCDIPSLDMNPEVIFPRVGMFLPMATSFVPAFFYSENAYDFGAIITVRSTDEKRVDKKSEVFTISNNSALPVILTAILCQDMLGNDPASLHFRVQPQRLSLEPGEKQCIRVFANPLKIGPVMDVLMFFIMSNPHVNFIQLKCEGVKSNVTVEPKVVNFNRLLLKRKDLRRLALTNHNTIPLFVKISEVEKLPWQFTFSRVSGWISPKSSLIIDITYLASEVQLISELPVHAQVFDDFMAEEPVQEIGFFLTAEAHDAALDVSFSTMDVDHVNFGEIPAEKEYTQVFNIKNVGKYPLSFKIDLNQELLTQVNNDNFCITPSEGKLLPQKLLPMRVVFKAQNEVIWDRVPLLKIMLMEPHSSDELIAIIPIQVSVKSYFARYEILPDQDFHFGHVKRGSALTGFMEIKNKGLFPLSYYIKNQNLMFKNQNPTNAPQTSPPSENVKSTKASAASRERAEKGKKFVSSVLTMGVFEISPSSGVTEPGKTSFIQIKCSPTEATTYKDDIVIFVSESLPQFKAGHKVTITAISCLPTLDFEDVKSIFREHLVYKTKQELSSSAKLGAHTLFVEKDATFFFENACVCKIEEARIHLPNSGLIDCPVRVSIGPAIGEEESGTSAAHCFHVSPNRLIIEPYNSGALLITFRPEAIKVHKARLTITLDIPEATPGIFQTYELVGYGILPQIEIKEPNSKLLDGQVLVNLPPTTPGHHSSSCIAFSNVGAIDCKVILELYKDKDDVFTLIPKSGTEKMLKVWEHTKPINHTTMMALPTGQTAMFNVMFHPKELKTYSSQIKLFIVDNPFENLSYKLKGEVFFEEVLIEKIRTTLPFLAQDEDGNDLKSPIYTAPDHYFLSFGDCLVKKKSRALLRLVNKTEKDYFKFEWDNFPSVTISPSVGHLYPDSYKEVLLVFLPEEPVQVEEASLFCSLNKILLSNTPQPSWDSRLNQNQKKSETEAAVSPELQQSKQKSFSSACEEPEFEVLPETTRTLVVSISGTADYCRLTCETSKIVFKQTFMFQSRTYPLVLKNPGKVAVDYKLLFKSVRVGPLKEDKELQVREASLLKLQRPQSSFHPSPHQNLVKENEVYPKRPRPVSSTSFLKMKLKPAQSMANEVEWNSVFEETDGAEPVPFSIENMSGQILPKDKVSCNIIFSPLSINEYKAVIAILATNLHPECVLPEIELTASSIMPYCHFNIPESDYLDSGRRNYSCPGPVGYSPGLPLDPDTKTIEIKVVGLGQTVPIKFHVINPTEKNYKFSWINTTQVQPKVVPSFHCSTMDGRIQAGRQQLMVFTFVSQRVGITESFWKFCIPKYKVETPFLLVGDVREPSVTCLSNHINLKPTVVGSSTFENLTLVNHENTPFDFSFLPNSLYSEGRLNALKVEPMTGEILPRSELNVRITFTGKTSGKFLFFLKCKLKSLQEPIVISVEAVTYVVQPLVTFEDIKKITHQANPESLKDLNFGTGLSLNLPETVTFVVASLSKISFYYEWDYDDKILESRFCKLTFSPKSGHVGSFSRGKCELALLFYKESSLKNFPVTLKIHRGPTYKFAINGSASFPLFELSFNSYDFGNCFLQKKDICFNETSLTIRNKDVVDLTLECYLSTSSAFSSSLCHAVISPHQEVAACIRFHPKEHILYADVIKLIFNGLHEKEVPLKGHGVDFKVTLANPEDTAVSLGAVRVGKTATRKFSIINKSLAPATLLVGFSDQLPVSAMHLANPQKNPIDLSKNHRLSKILIITPSTSFQIKSGEVTTLNVTYTPQQRTVPFSETVSLQFQEKAEPLCVLTGCSLGPEFSLDRTFMNFGAVVKTCLRALKVKIINSGSMGAKFEWSFECPENEFFISPNSGYCSPESDVTIQVTFQPSSVRNSIKAKAECKLFLSENETYPSLFLSIAGDCVSLPHPQQEVYFECFVRETDTKTIEVENGTGNKWKLQPIITGDFFKGHEVLIVSPLSSAQYEVTYSPQEMTEAGKVHEGSIFFRLPTGQALLYCLTGVSLPPNPEDIVTRIVPSKTKYTELLRIRNWLQFSQRFKVNISCVTNDNPEDPVWTCDGFKHLEVPGLMQKEYSLNFFAYKLGTLRFHVSFINEESKEYVWFDVTFKIVMCGPLEVITLKSGVRQTCYYKLKLENPLHNPVTYTLETTSPEVHFQSLYQEVLPQQAVFVKLSFTPIHATERIEKLNATCPELGEFLWDLRLISVNVPPEPPRIFETPLGTFQTQKIEIKNFSHLNAVLSCRVDSDDFEINEQESVSAGQTTDITVIFEPSSIGSTTATLFVESTEAGNFVFRLLGICVKPPAQGPFEITPNSELVIPFKNVFKKAQDFQMYVDNRAFVLKSTQESILPKEECIIHIEMKKLNELEKLKEYKERHIEARFPFTGQLVVECFNPYVKWQFYLKGLLDSES